VILRYRLTPTAQENIDGICAFIAEDSVDAAIRFFDTLERAFEHLGEMPELGHKHEDLTDRPVASGPCPCATPDGPVATQIPP
jgi:plasmid stabilization system protein ParE